MRFNGKGYMAARTRERETTLPSPKECLEDSTEAMLCDIRWEIEMSKPDQYDVYTRDVEIE